MNPDTPRYRIDAFRSFDTVNEGSDYDTTADTLKEAKSRARYCLSADFQVSGEMSARFGYARVVDMRDGSCAFDVFGETTS